MYSSYISWASGTPTVRWMVRTPADLIHFYLQNFYIEFRRSLLHPHMNPRGGDDFWVTPTSLSDWKTERASTKLDALAQIVAHHHAQDNASPVKINADGQTLEFEQVEPLGPPDGKQDPDRIIIFSLFPSSNSGIKDVSHPMRVVSFYLLKCSGS